MKVLKQNGRDGFKILQALLEKGADPDRPDSEGKSPLFYCISHYNSTELVELFIEFGAKVDISESDANHEYAAFGTTLLLEAVERDNFDICRNLLENGANPNRSSILMNNSPLSGAATNGSVALVKLLIRYGADLAHANAEGCTIVHDAVLSGSLETLYTLLYAGAPHDRKDNKNNTPLMITALLENNIGIMNALLDHEHGCNINNANQCLDTALHFAAFSKKPKDVRLLIEYGGDPNLRNDVNATPLWNAAYSGASEVVRELLVANVEMEVMSRGRDPMTFDIVGPDFFYPQARSPLYVALDKGHTDIVMLLKDAGYDIWKETWIQSETIPNQDLYAALVVDWIVASKSPDRLENLCKNKLRKYLASEPGGDIYQKVERLKYPQLLKDCLLLKNLH